MAIAPNKFMVSCSFCNKDNEQVKKLIAGPGVYICDECVGLCNTILDEVGTGSAPTSSPTPPLDEGPIDRLVTLFGGMARTAQSMDDRLAEWARTLAERGVPVHTLASEAGLSEVEATERFKL